MPFTNHPYKVCTSLITQNNNWCHYTNHPYKVRTLLITQRVIMNRVRRRNERDRYRRVRESPEQRESRLANRREKDRIKWGAIAIKQRDAIVQASTDGFLRLHNISNSTHLQEQLSEDQHLQQESSSTSQTITLQPTPSTNNQPSISSHPTTSCCTTPIMLHDTTPSPPIMSYTTTSPVMSHDITLSPSTPSSNDTLSPPVMLHSQNTITTLVNTRYNTVSIT